MFGCFCRSSGNENSGEDTDQGMNANETDKYKAMTLEWEKQVQDLHQTLKKKEEQIHTYEKQFEATASTMKNKDNRIIELEKEVEQLQELLTEAAGKLEEIQNAKKEETGRPSSTWTRVTEEKDKKIEKLESEVRKHTYNLQGIVNTELWEKNREIEKLQNRLTDKIKIKDEDISKLEKELMGKDMQLKILKDKIEELGIHVNLPSSLISLKQEDKLEIPEELNVLKEKLKLSTEKSKYLQKIVEELSLQLRNTPERESNGKLEQIKTEFTQLQLDFDKSEKSRMEVTNVCVLLTTRLEELAHFLDSLLKHKSVLGLLGIKQHSAIKNAIDQSLDLSKTFNISMMGEDKSLTQLSSLSAFLNASQISNMSLFESYLEDEPNKRASIPVNSVSLTYNSHLSRQNGELQNAKEIINVLREQIQTMKKEIEIRDMELANQNIVSDIQEKSLKNDNELVEVLMDLQSKSPLNKKAIEVMSPNKIYQNLIDNNKTSSPNQKHVVDNQSESETWSEPDRDVSQARIGLDAESLKSSTNTSLARSRSNKHSSGDWVSTESTEDDVSSSKSNSPTKRNAGGDSRRVNVLQENISVLENKLKEKDNELLMLQCKVMDSDNKVKESQIKMHADLEKLRKEKTETENLLLDREKIIETCDKKREELEIKLTEVSKEKSSIIENIKQKEAEIEELKEKMINLQKIIENNNINVQSKLKENDEKWQIMLTNMEKEAELRISEIKDATAQLKEKYEKEWIQKEELNKYHTKMEMVYSELESLKEVLKSAENKGRKLEQDSLDSNKKIQEMERENREKIIALKRELNEYALRTSQAVLERTKVSNEKLKLEQELRRVETREKEKSSEYTEKEKQYINIKNNIQKQLSQLELQKSHLQLKVTELETTNVELHNRILRLQSGDTSNWPKSTPTSPIKISDNFPNIQHMGKHSLGTRFTYNRQRSDMSGYVSEDILTDDNEGGVFNRSAPEGYHWFSHVNHNVAADVADARNIANSSPDLGIESDPGRFSSLETNVSRPLLQTLELTASMNNLLSDNHNEPSGQYCNVPMHKNLQKHNDDLQKTISRLATGLEKTKAQLSLMNKTKKQVEKAVCKEIHKTSIVLRKARANLDSGSENEVLRK